MSALTKIDGKPIVDADKDLEISVTARDINANAKRKNPAECVFAQACYREVECKDVRVHKTRFYILDPKGKHYVRFIAPSAIRSETIAYDRGGAIEVGDYVLKAPVGTQMLGAKPGRKEPEGKRGKTPRWPHHVTMNVRAKPSNR